LQDGAGSAFFALAYNSLTANGTRTEFGARFDNFTTLSSMPLVLRMRLAWAHDFLSTLALNAVFEAQPGSNFTVNGAPIPHDSALTSAGAQLFFAPNWSLLAKFDSEFASGSQAYAGTATLRYVCGDSKHRRCLLPALSRRLAVMA
jgi:uncharacterized protein with beta-barrel porin domain